MTDVNENGLQITAQDLSSLSPSVSDDNRMYHHDGSSSIPLTGGGSTTQRGYYIWSEDTQNWLSPFKNADLIDGKHAGDFLHRDGSLAMEADLDVGTNNLLNVVEASGSTGGIHFNTNHFELHSHSSGSNFKFFDSNNLLLLEGKEGGNVEIPNGDLRVINNNNILLDTGYIYGENEEYVNFGGGAILFDVNDGSGNSIDSLNLLRGGNVEIPNGNLHLATGQSIEDGSGTERILLDSNDTTIRNDAGGNAFFSRDGFATQMNAYSSTPARIYDGESGSAGVQYDTDLNAGVLRTPNAGVVVEDGMLTANEGIHQFYDTTAEAGVIRSRDQSTTTDKELQVLGSPLKLKGTGGLVDMSGSNANLRLATGQSIEDGSGKTRLGLGSSRTVIRNQNDTATFGAYGGDKAEIQVDGTENFQLYDNSGAGTAVQYDTDTSAGVLRTPNASLNIENKGDAFSTKTNASVGIHYSSDFTAGQIETYDPSISDHRELQIYGDPVSIAPNGANLRLATGQSIEDGSGVNRLELRSSNTTLYGEAGDSMLFLDESAGVASLSSPYNLRIATGQAIEDGSGEGRFLIGSSTTDVKDPDGDTTFASRKSSVNRSGAEIRAYSDKSPHIEDREGSFTAVQYITGTSTGTLELTNAILDGKASNGYDHSGTSVLSSIHLSGTGTTYSSGITFETTEGERSSLRTQDGELAGMDDAGNETILT